MIKIYKARVTIDIVVEAENRMDADVIMRKAIDIDGLNFEYDQLPSIIQSTGELPEGWDEKCMAFSIDEYPVDQRNIGERLEALKNESNHS